jgi:hypothetical protein
MKNILIILNFIFIFNYSISGNSIKLEYPGNIESIGAGGCIFLPKNSESAVLLNPTNIHNLEDVMLNVFSFNTNIDSFPVFSNLLRGYSTTQEEINLTFNSYRKHPFNNSFYTNITFLNFGIGAFANTTAGMHYPPQANLLIPISFSYKPLGNLDIGGTIKYIMLRGLNKKINTLEETKDINIANFIAHKGISLSCGLNYNFEYCKTGVILQDILSYLLNYENNEASNIKPNLVLGLSKELSTDIPSLKRFDIGLEIDNFSKENGISPDLHFGGIGEFLFFKDYLKFILCAGLEKKETFNLTYSITARAFGINIGYLVNNMKSFKLDFNF